MASTTVNGPTLMKTEIIPVVSGKVRFTYDNVVDGEVVDVELHTDDKVRIKYMKDAYNPTLVEVVGRVDGFSIPTMSRRPSQFHGAYSVPSSFDFINNTKFEPSDVTGLKLDVSSEFKQEVIYIPEAAIRELEILSSNYSSGTTKPDCEDPGSDCPYNPSCQCPSYNGDCKPPVAEGSNDWWIIPALENGYTARVLLEGEDPSYYCSLSDAINALNAGIFSNIEQPVIEVFGDYVQGNRPEYIVIKRSCKVVGVGAEIGRKKPSIFGAINVMADCSDIIISNIEVIHNGVDQYSTAITLTAGILVVDKVSTVLSDFKWHECTCEEDCKCAVYPHALAAASYDNNATTGLSIKSLYIDGYPRTEQPVYEVFNPNSFNAPVLICRNTDIYGDCFILGGFDEASKNIRSLGSNPDTDPHFNMVVADYGFESPVLSIGALSKEGFLYAIGDDRVSLVANYSVLDFDKDNYVNLAIPTGYTFINRGVLSLGNITLNIKGTFINEGLVSGGTLILDNKDNLTTRFNHKDIKILPASAAVQFYGTKVRVNGTQIIVKTDQLKNLAKSTVETE